MAYHQVHLRPHLPLWSQVICVALGSLLIVIMLNAAVN